MRKDKQTNAEAKTKKRQLVTTCYTGSTLNRLIFSISRKKGQNQSGKTHQRNSDPLDARFVPGDSEENKIKDDPSIDE